MNQAATDPMTIIHGGVDITVRLNDGTDAQIKVRQLPLRLMPAYGSAIGDEGKLIELFTEKPTDWVDSLSQASQEAVVELGEQLNLDPFFRWSERRLKATNRLAPLTALASASAKFVPPSVLAAVTPPGSSVS